MPALSPAAVILDSVEKSFGLSVLQLELNDQPGVCVKLAGSLANVNGAADAARSLGAEMAVRVVAAVIPTPERSAEPANLPRPDFNPLLEQTTIQIPQSEFGTEASRLAQQVDFAIGFIETQGFTAVFAAVDAAVKAAAVDVLAREKLGGGYITVVIKGDVAAVQSAIDTAKERVEGLGRLIAAHVIPSPSSAVLSILPKL